VLGGDVECLGKPLIACIGPVTAKAVEEVLGRPPDVVAAEHTVPGLVRALVEYSEAAKRHMARKLSRREI